MYPLTIGLAIENRELWEQAQACLADLPFRIIVEHQDIGDVSNFLDRLERMRPDVVLVDISGWKEPLEGLVASIRTAIGDPMIIALNTSAESDAILASLRAGINEYLYPPLQEPLKRALEKRSAERSRRRDGGTKAGGKSFAFLSAKGGCGATTLISHVAAELGRQNQKVLLADLDLDAGMVASSPKPSRSTRFWTRSTTCTGWIFIIGRRWSPTASRAWRLWLRRWRWRPSSSPRTSRCARCWPSPGRTTIGRWWTWGAA